MLLLYIQSLMQGLSTIRFQIQKTCNWVYDYKFRTHLAFFCDNSAFASKYRLGIPHQLWATNKETYLDYTSLQIAYILYQTGVSGSDINSMEKKKQKSLQEIKKKKFNQKKTWDKDGW